MRFKDIIPLAQNSSYVVSVPFDGIMDQIRRCKPKVDPEFQRVHVWTDQQASAYVEYILRDGRSGRDLYFNHPNWMGSYEGRMVCVDGKQRLRAIAMFMQNLLPAFGQLRSEFPDHIPMHASINWHVNTLQTEREIIEWYLALNTGGTPHTEDELNRVRDLLRSM